MASNKNPANRSKPTTLSWLDKTGAEHTAIAGPSRLSDALYFASPYRKAHQYPKRRHYTGEHWFSNTGTHVWYESLFERQAMLWLDFSHTIVAISSQPMQMLLGNGTKHVPDLIALHSSHRQVVYDIKPPELVTADAREQFKETARVCQAVGWGYEVLSSFEPVTRRNLNWLSNFRQNRFAPPAEARARLMDALVGPLALEQAAAAMKAEVPNVAKAWLYHLVWLGQVRLDLTQALSNTTLVRKAS